MQGFLLLHSVKGAAVLGFERGHGLLFRTTGVSVRVAAFQICFSDMYVDCMWMGCARGFRWLVGNAPVRSRLLQPSLPSAAPRPPDGGDLSRSRSTPMKSTLCRRPSSSRRPSWRSASSWVRMGHRGCPQLSVSLPHDHAARPATPPQNRAASASVTHLGAPPLPPPPRHTGHRLQRGLHATLPHRRVPDPRPGLRERRDHHGVSRVAQPFDAWYPL
jgi:hypothetical protein